MIFVLVVTAETGPLFVTDEHRIYMGVTKSELCSWLVASPPFQVHW